MPFIIVTAGAQYSFLAFAIDVCVELNVKGGENGKTFGSVTSKEISDGLNQQGLNVDKKQIVLKDPIKNAGEYVVDAKLFAGVSAKFKVIVKTI